MNIYEQIKDHEKRIKFLEGKLKDTIKINKELEKCLYMQQGLNDKMIKHLGMLCKKK